MGMTFPHRHGFPPHKGRRHRETSPDDLVELCLAQASTLNCKRGSSDLLGFLSSAVRLLPQFCRHHPLQDAVDRAFYCALAGLADLLRALPAPTRLISANSLSKTLLPPCSTAMWRDSRNATANSQEWS